MSESGSYILNEYFILKLIFSYLPSRDLHNAAKVCRNWNVIASRALAENGEPQSCCVINGNDVIPPLNEKQSPKIILDLTANSLSSALITVARVVQLLRDTYYLENTCLYNIHADPYIFSWKSEEKSVIGSLTCKSGKGSDPVHSLMLLGNMPGINIECFEECQKRIVNAADGTMGNVEHISRAKGILLIVGSRNSSANQAQILLDELIQICKSKGSSESELLLAGGMTRNVRRIHSTSYQKTEIVGITFSGENVTVHGDIHIPHKITLELFMRKFSDRVGKLPEGCIRMAFAFVCINRKDTYRDLNLFKEYFPGVPIYGYYSLGEYFLRGPKGDCSEDAKRFVDPKRSFVPEQENYFYTDSTSFLIVTLKKTKISSS